MKSYLPLLACLTALLAVSLSVGSLLEAKIEQKGSVEQFQAQWDAVKEDCRGTPAGRNIKEQTVRVICEDGSEYYIPQELKI